MCGIAGFVHAGAGAAADGSASGLALRRMTDAIAHRGPDGEGFWQAPGVGLGHRRLAIIDLEGGAQPMASRDGSVRVTYNGEIYNHLELRRRLEGRGHVFSTRCDTEVLLHGYLEWGQELPRHLNGMFAFALWDSRERVLLLARDRFGEKPLFYSLRPDGSLLFASEAKALVAHPALDAAVADEGLAAYLTFEYLPGDLSMFRGVHKVLPAHVLVWRDGNVQTRPYWRLPIEENGSRPRAADAAREFLDCFDRAVERRLMADVPLGVFLSGGIDSSAVAASVVAQRDPGSVKTFTIGFDEPSYDESSPARLVARHLGTDHHERQCNATTLLEVLPRIIAKLDEPFGDASLLPTFLLCEFTREHVTVAVGGDGGDELLLGYPTFRAEPVAKLFRALPAPLRGWARGLADHLPVDTRNFSFDFVVRSFLAAADAPDAERHPLWLGSVIPGGPDDPLVPDLRREFPLARVLEPAVRAYREAGTRSPWQRLTAQYCHTYLPDDILHKVDRASMMVSLEARSPFLDPELVEYLGPLPTRYKRRWTGASKRILKRATAPRLPPSVLARAKKGFGVPIAAWLNGPLASVLDDLLDDTRVTQAGYLRPEVVRRLVREHRSGARNHRKTLWTLMSFEWWRSRYLVGARA